MKLEMAAGGVAVYFGYCFLLFFFKQVGQKGAEGVKEAFESYGGLRKQQTARKAQHRLRFPFQPDLKIHRKDCDNDATYFAAGAAGYVSPSAIIGTLLNVNATFGRAEMLVPCVVT